MKAKERDICEVLVYNFDKIIIHFATDYDVKATLEAY